MAHAEKCPICNGSGQVGEEQSRQGRSVGYAECHGCNGKGWVEVGDDAPVAIPAIPWPIHPPYYPYITYYYPSDRGL